MVSVGQFHFFDDLDEIQRRHAICHLSIDIGAGHLVEPGDLTRSHGMFHAADGTHGDHSLFAGELQIHHIVHPRPVGSLGLHDHLVCAAVHIEIVDIECGKIVLQGFEDRFSSQSHCLCFSAVDGKIQLRCIGIVTAHHAFCFFHLIQTVYQIICLFRQFRRCHIADRAELEPDTAQAAQSAQCRRGEAHDLGFVDIGCPFLDFFNDVTHLCFRSFPLVPVFQPDHALSAMFSRPAHRSKAGNEHDPADPGDVFDPGIDAVAHRIGTVESGRLRQFNIHHDRAFIFIGQEGFRHLLIKIPHTVNRGGKKDHSHDRTFHKQFYQKEIYKSHSVDDQIEGICPPGHFLRRFFQDQ